MVDVWYLWQNISLNDLSLRFLISSGDLTFTLCLILICDVYVYIVDLYICAKLYISAPPDTR